MGSFVGKQFENDRPAFPFPETLMYQGGVGRGMSLRNFDEVVWGLHREVSSHILAVGRSKLISEVHQAKCMRTIPKYPEWGGRNTLHAFQELGSPSAHRL